MAAPNLPNIVSTNVAEGPNKIFVGGLPSYLNEEQVKQLIGTFGQLRSFNLVKDNQTGKIAKRFRFLTVLKEFRKDLHFMSIWILISLTEHAKDLME